MKYELQDNTNQTRWLCKFRTFNVIVTKGMQTSKFPTFNLITNRTPSEKKNTETSNKEVVESRLWLRSSWNQFSSSWYHFKWFLSCGKTHVWLSLMESIGLFSLSMHQCIVTTRWWAIGNLTARASSCIGHFVQENMRCCCWNRNIFAVDESVQRD